MTARNNRGLVGSGSGFMPGMITPPDVAISAVYTIPNSPTQTVRNALTAPSDIDPTVVNYNDDRGTGLIIHVNFTWTEHVYDFYDPEINIVATDSGGKNSLGQDIPLPERNSARGYTTLPLSPALGGGGTFTKTITPAHNSAGTILITVPVSVAESRENPNTYGPIVPRSFEIKYDNLHIDLPETKPTVKIIPPLTVSSFLYSDKAVATDVTSDTLPIISSGAPTTGFEGGLWILTAQDGGLMPGLYMYTNNSWEIINDKANIGNFFGDINIRQTNKVWIGGGILAPATATGSGKVFDNASALRWLTVHALEGVTYFWAEGTTLKKISFTSSQIVENAFVGMPIEDAEDSDFIGETLPRVQPTPPMGTAYSNGDTVNTGDLLVTTSGITGIYINSEGTIWKLVPSLENFFSEFRMGTEQTVKWLGVGSVAEENSAMVNTDDEARDWFQNNLKGDIPPDTTYFWINGVELRKATLDDYIPGSVYIGTTAEIGFVWSEDIDISDFNDASDIEVTSMSEDGSVLNIGVTDPSPDPSSSLQNFKCNLTLPSDETGIVNINIPKESVSDLESHEGPPENTFISFNFDNTGTYIIDIDYDINTHTRDVTPICDGTVAFNAAIPDTNPAIQGAYKGVMDCIKIGNFLYVIMQIQRRADSRPNELANQLPSAAALLEIDTRVENSCRVIKTYDYLLAAPQHLIEHDGKLFFFEGSHLAYSYLETGSAGISDWRDDVGNLRCVEPGSNTVEDAGLVWRYRLTHPTDTTSLYENSVYGILGGASSPIVSDGEYIYIMAGFGDYRNYNTTYVANNRREGFPVTHIDSVLWLQYGKDLNRRIDKLETNGKSVWAVLLEIASLTASYIGFDNNQFYMLPRYPIKAELNETLDDSETTLKLINNNRDIPNKGYLLIENEIIGYGETAPLIEMGDEEEGIITINNLKRGDEESVASSHAVELDVYYVNHIIDTRHLENPMDAIELEQDINQLYNQILIRFGEDGEQEHYQEDEESVETNGGRIFELDLPLNRHQTKWVEWLAKLYLDTFKDIHYIANVSLKSSLYLRVGEVIMIRDVRKAGERTLESEIYDSTPFQILSVNHSKNEQKTDIQIRSIL